MNSTRFGVVGVFYELGEHGMHGTPDMPANGNQFLELLQQRLPSSQGHSDTKSDLFAFDLDMLVSGLSLENYWTYPGSLTTPPCTQTVDWFPLMDAARLSARQLAVFRAAIGQAAAGGNFRPPQPLAGRSVEGCELHPWYPYTDNGWSAGVGGAHPICAAGHFQSPVDLPTCEPTGIRQASSDSTGGEMREPIVVDWGGKRDAVLKNTGHALQVDVVDSAAARTTVSHGALQREYTLLQCHFHYGSEHTVGGRQKDMVAHCVHSKDGHRGRYGVLGVFFASASGNATHASLVDIEDLLPRLPAQKATSRAGGVASVASVEVQFDFGGIVDGLSLQEYWSYDGSFTTPPCTEAVDWYVLMQDAACSPSQLDKFRAATGWADAGGNFRPPQPLSGRHVDGCPVPIVAGSPATASWYPYDAEAWASQVADASAVCKEGTQQSPVDLPECATTKARSPLALRWGSQPVCAEHDGHTVVLRLEPQLPMPSMSTDGSAMYALLQCHFHVGSEHTVGGRQWDLSIHCVHARLADGSGQVRAAVVGIMYGSNSTENMSNNTENAFLSNVVSSLPSKDAANPVELGVLNLNEMYADSRLDRYWSYEGSLTTPPCTEMVDWFVLMDLQTVSQSQLVKMTEAIGMPGGNFRPPQPLSERFVDGCVGRPNSIVQASRPVSGQEPDANAATASVTPSAMLPTLGLLVSFLVGLRTAACSSSGLV